MSSAPTIAVRSQLEERFLTEIAPQIQKEKNYQSIMQVPRLSKIVLNMGLGEAISDKKHLQAALEDLRQISGQQAVTTVARKSIAGFKIREGYPIGCKVTLRRHRMYDFFERLVTMALPRSRDFRGLPARSFDGRGNYNFGVREQIIFHEVKYESVDVFRGLDIAIATTSLTDEGAYDLLVKMGLPLKPIEKPIEK